MKKKILTLLLVAISAISCNDGIWNAIHDLEDKYTDLDGRVAKLEELCKEMNTNISSLKTLVNVILNNDYIISTTPITKDGNEIGYVITFAIHEPITIYHGQNGKDGADGKNGQDGKDGKNGENGTNGQNGKDGADGITPIIGVAQDETDHAYYWTLNGEWLLDANGNRIPLTSRDGINGQDGQDGKDGKDGKDGTNGQDGITPRLKIENGYWFISYDNGVTWVQLGKAVGENGQDGQNGKNGQDGEKGDKGDPGDTMFSSVTQDDYYVYFTLSNGTVIKIPVASEDYGTDPENRVEVVNGVIMTGFSVATNRQVYFTNGNLQYQPSTGAWRFAKRQYDNLGLSTNDITSTYNGWIDFFNATDISGCGYMDTCRILTESEWNYLMDRHSGNYYKFAFARVNNVFGLIILPDVFIQPRGIAQLQVAPYPVPSGGYTKYYYTENLITAQAWREYENVGVVFLPMTNSLSESSSKGQGYYWCSNFSNRLYFDISVSPYSQYKPGGSGTSSGPHSIRLVKDVE